MKVNFSKSGRLPDPLLRLSIVYIHCMNVYNDLHDATIYVHPVRKRFHYIIFNNLFVLCLLLTFPYTSTKSVSKRFHYVSVVECTGLVIFYITLTLPHVLVQLTSYILHIVTRTTVYHAMKTEKNRYYRATWPRSNFLHQTDIASFL